MKLLGGAGAGLLTSLVLVVVPATPTAAAWCTYDQLTNDTSANDITNRLAISNDAGSTIRFHGR